MRWISVALVVTSSTVSAQSLTFDAALALAEARVDVRGTRAELARRRELDRRIRRAGGNPQIWLQPGWRTAPAGEEGFELQAQLTQQISLAGVGSARRAAARAERSVLSAEERARMLAAKLDVARAWIELWAATETTRVVRERRELVTRWQRLIDRARELGAATRVDTGLVVAEGGELSELSESNRLERLRREVVLAGALNLPGRANIEGPAPQLELPPLEQVARMDASGLPAVQLADAVARREAARLREARANAGPSLSLGGQIALDSPGGVVVSGLIGTTLPVFERNQRGRSQQRGALARAEVEAEGAHLDGRRLLQAAVASVERARSVETVMVESTLPALESLADSYRRRREAGEVLVFEELAAQRRWLDARARAVDVRAARTWAEVRLRLLLNSVEGP